MAVSTNLKRRIWPYALVVLTVGLLLAGGAGVRPASSRAQRAVTSVLPLAAQGPVSRELGRADRRYRVVATAGGYAVSNPSEQFAARFGSKGVEVRSGSGRLGLSLRAYGYGRVLHPVGAAALGVAANRIVYRRTGLVEWFVNGPLGLEQGFTLAAPPRGARVGRLTVALGLSGNMRGLLAPSRDAVTFTDRGRQHTLVYRGLVVTDARGRLLPASIELARGRLLLRVSDRAARYPVTIDPLVQQAKLTASDGGATDVLGGSVAVSGGTIVAGATGATVGPNDSQGAVYVFVKPAGGWANATETAKLTASDGVRNDNLGAAVSVSGDTIVAGAPSFGRGDAGAAYVFVKPAGGWANATETAKLTASVGQSDDELGASVAVSGDTIVAGARATVGANDHQGVAYVFVRPAGGWASATETARLTASDGARNDQLGSSVAISGDTVVAGAWFATVGTNPFQGAAYVFSRPVTGWANATETAKLTASDGATGDNLGRSVALSGDTIVAGAPSIPAVAGNGVGAAYVFVKPAGGWANATETAKLTASDGGIDLLGDSVAVSGDTIAAGAPSATVGGNDGQGAVYVFVKPAGGWASATETTRLTASDGASGDDFGISASSSGDTIAVGAWGATTAASPAQGAAYVFGLPAVADTTPPVLTLPNTISIDAIGPAGAIVSYMATAIDNLDPSPVVSCTPLSGSLFAIGDTSVNCTATDSAGNNATGAFTVHVRGAAEQLANLAADVHGVGPGTSLAATVAIAQLLLAHGQTHATCLTLTTFTLEVRAQTGKKIQPGTTLPSQAGSLIATAQRIENVIGC